MDYNITWASQKMMKLDLKKDNPYPLHNIVNYIICLELKTIWKESFHDFDQYIDNFFMKCFNPRNTIIVIDSNHIIGAAYLLPASIITKEGEQQVLFGYALGILKKYRGQGITRKIHDFIYSYCNENNYSFIVYPANDKLATYYASTGLKKVGYINKVNYHFHDLYGIDKLELVDIDAGEYLKFRNDYFMREGYLKWSQAAIEYAIDENRLCGGFCKKLNYQGEEYVLLGKVIDSKLILTEITTPKDILQGIMQSLASYFNVWNITVYLPVTSKINNCSSTLQLMGYGTDFFREGYFNLFLN